MNLKPDPFEKLLLDLSPKSMLKTFISDHKSERITKKKGNSSKYPTENLYVGTNEKFNKHVFYTSFVIYTSVGIHSKIQPSYNSCFNFVCTTSFTVTSFLLLALFSFLFRRRSTLSFYLNFKYYQKLYNCFPDKKIVFSCLLHIVDE